MIEKVLGILLIIIGIILAVVEHADHFYGRGNEGYFYGLAAVIAIIGVILIAWGYMKGSSSKKPA
jgi:predicted tellurium resistance membrane protein TerC